MVVRSTTPPYLYGKEIEKDIGYYGTLETVRKWVNWHNPASMADGYGP